MSCTHDCGCTPETRDARTDEWVQIAPESARPATLTPEQPVKAPVEGEDSPSPSEPVLPRPIKPEDVRPGMVVERRNSETYVGGRVKSTSGLYILTDAGTVAWSFNYERVFQGWTLWLVEDAPEPVDPDAEAVERMAKEVHDRNCADVGCRDWDGHGESTRKAWREDARVVIRNLRAQGFDVTARAEQ